MTELRQRMIEDMRLRGLAEGTQRVYVDPPGYESDDRENRNLLLHPDLCVSSPPAET